jgi:membrane associated rhomboid family serine protease
MHQFTAPSMSRFNKGLLIAVGVMFILHSILSSTGVTSSLPAILGLSSTGVFSGLIFQIVTYPFINVSLMGLLFEALLIWFLGSELESRWGTKTYIQFFAASVIGAAIIYLILSATVFSSFAAAVPLIGLAGFGHALCLAYAIIYPDRQFLFMFIFPMKAKWFCALMVGILLYSGIFSQGSKSAWGHLAAMLVGYLFLHFKARGLAKSRSGGDGPYHPVNNWLKSREAKKRQKRVKDSDFYIVPDEDDDDKPTYH